MSIPRAKLLDRLAGSLLIRALLPARWLRDLLSDDRPLQGVREIVVTKFWGIGNVALLIPVLDDLKRRYPGARLSVVTLEINRSLFEGVADRIWTVRMKPLDCAVRDLVRAGTALRRLDIDLAIDFEHYVRTSQPLLFLSGARQIIAFDTAGLNRATLADVRVPYDNERHASEGYLDLARAAGVRRAHYEAGGLAPTVDAQRSVDALLEPHAAAEAPLVVLHPGSGDNFPGRRWPTRRFGLLARRLIDERGARVAVTAGAGEADLVREVVEASERPLLDLAGKLTLDELVALLARSDLLVANDTGPVHLASALGVPVLGLYGPNTPALYGPLSANSRAFYEPPPCSPCMTNFNYKTSRCLNPVCIRAIQLDTVAQAALRRLDRAERRRGSGA